MKKNLLATTAIGLTLAAPFAYADDTENKLEVKPYGFILPKYNYSTTGLKTFSTQGETAPTAVASQYGPASPSLSSTSQQPVVNGDNIYSRGTWQIGQTRFGLEFKSGPSLSGKIEVDFFNNNDSEPSFALLAPRLRLASIQYKFSDDMTLLAGQFWDIFNGDVNPITYNPVANYFQTGNLGFMRQQFAIRMGHDTGMNVTFAVGMPAKNDNSASTTGATKDAAGEFSGIPTLAANLTYKESANDWMGLSAIAGRVVFSGGTVGSDSHTAYGFSAFTSRMFGGTKVRAKAYYGQNLGNLNALTIGSGAGLNKAKTAYDVSEYGGFLTGWTPLTESLGFLVGAGYAKVPTTLLGLDAKSSVMTANLKIAAGLDYQLVKNLKMFGEYTYMNSSYTETAAAVVTSYNASLVEVGFKYDI